MSDFSVVVSSVAQTAALSSSIGCDLAAELVQLRRMADDVLTSGWRGQAAAAFDRAWTCWDAGAREVVAALSDLAELLGDTGRAYELRDAVSSDQLRMAVS